MTAYPVLVKPSAYSRPEPVRRQPLCVCRIGAFALTSWDLFLDPQMVSAGYWRWNHNAVDLPGFPVSQP